MYTIIDIETTGGSPVSEKITEVAAFVHDGKKVVDKFISLVNPEKKIPFYITQLTGISNAMVAKAPKFYEIAKELVEITRGNVFVAHNASFDYSFIQQEYKRLGYNFEREMLCTVSLSRMILPGRQSYSLGKICKDLDITITDRHRAEGDALATVRLFEILMEKNEDSIDFLNLPGIRKKDLHPNLNPDILKRLPNEVGVYYFFNEKQELIYIGKSKNIRTRILSHFRNYKSKKAIEMRQEICDIDYELTGNELIALLKESKEIKENKPIYNRALRRGMSHYGIFDYVDKNGYIRFEVSRLTDNINQALITFTSKINAVNFLNSLLTNHQLCQKLCGLYKTSGGCFHYEIRECKGACLGKESAEDYNKRAGLVLAKYQFISKKFYIIERGRNEQELAVIKISNNEYKGYGYFDKEYYSGNTEILDDCITLCKDDKDTRMILRSYLHNGKPIDLIRK